MHAFCDTYESKTSMNTPTRLYKKKLSIKSRGSAEGGVSGALYLLPHNT